jgi:hypothetical protein
MSCENTDDEAKISTVFPPCQPENFHYDIGQCRAKHVFDLVMEYERMVSVCSLHTVLM